MFPSKAHSKLYLERFKEIGVVTLAPVAEKTKVVKKVQENKVETTLSPH